MWTLAILYLKIFSNFSTTEMAMALIWFTACNHPKTRIDKLAYDILPDFLIVDIALTVNKAEIFAVIFYFLESWGNTLIIIVTLKCAELRLISSLSEVCTEISLMRTNTHFESKFDERDSCLRKLWSDHCKLNRWCVSVVAQVAFVHSILHEKKRINDAGT